jgi:coproporphyrinogen III oxidase-like Fe-S oxidoreductase
MAGCAIHSTVELLAARPAASERGSLYCRPCADHLIFCYVHVASTTTLNSGRSGGGGMLAVAFGLVPSSSAPIGAFLPTTLGPPSLSSWNAPNLLPVEQQGRGVLTSMNRRRQRQQQRRRCNVVRAATNKLKEPSDQQEESNGVGLYVHIPYCRRRCRYCDFAIVPIGSAAAADSSLQSDTSSSMATSRANDGFHKMDDSYRSAILEELGLIRQTASTEGNKIPLRSIYFGGGTPSLAPTSTLRSILSAIIDPDDGPFYIPEGDDGIEVTIEMDPGTFTEDKLRELRDAGFNRISLGVQSFDDAILESIGRFHRRKDVMESIEMIGRVFGDRRKENDHSDGSSTAASSFTYSLDLISGLPGLSLSKWAETLEMAMNLDPRPDHLSLYDLQVEEGTVFGKWYGTEREENDEEGRNGNALAQTRSPPTINFEAGTSRELPFLPSADDCAYMYRYASGYLRSRGYEHYEISSYAQLGRRSKHNQIYWEVQSTWYAIGLGSTSSIDGRRFARPRTMADYIDWVSDQREKFETGEGLPSWLEADDDDKVDDGDFLTDVIMTKLRTLQGLDLNWIRHTDVGGEAKADAILRGAELALDMGLAEREQNDDKSYDYLRLQDPDGFLFSNNIISQIFVELDEVTD